MKIDRLIGIITILQQNKKVTAPYLAKKFEVSRRTISLGYFGSEGDLELLKGYISEMEWVRKTGVKALGIYEHGGRMVYVSTDGAIEAGGNIVEDIVQLDKYKSITTDILIFEPLTKEQLIILGEWLLSYNEPIKTVSVMAWVAGCFIKPHLKKSGIKFPHLLLVGEQGSGKSNTLERVILPVFSCSKIRAATQVTAFTLMKESASSNLIPQLMDEFKCKSQYHSVQKMENNNVQKIELRIRNV